MILIFFSRFVFIAHDEFVLGFFFSALVFVNRALGICFLCPCPLSCSCLRTSATVALALVPYLECRYKAMYILWQRCNRDQ